MLFRSLAIWLLLAGSLLSQEIGGLSSVAVGSELRLPVKGLTAPSGTLEQLAAWAGKLVVGADSPTGSTSSVDLDIGLARRQPTIYFSADSPGMYVVCLVDTSSATPTILTKRVQVGEVVPPGPNPPPPGPPLPPPPPVPPTPPPVTTGPRLIVLVREASNVTPTQSRTEILLRLKPCDDYFKSKGHALLILSDDRGIPPNVPAAHKDAIRAAVTAGDRRIIICDPATPTAAGVLAIESYAATTTSDQILDIIKKYGG